MLDGSKAEHPAWMGWEHAQAPAQVRPLTYAGLKHVVRFENVSGEKVCSPCRTECIFLVLDIPGM